MDSAINDLPHILRIVWPYLGFINASLLLIAVIILIFIVEPRLRALRNYRSETTRFLSEESTTLLDIKAELVSFNERLTSIEASLKGKNELGHNSLLRNTDLPGNS
jgi:hypothetical protein